MSSHDANTRTRILDASVRLMADRGGKGVRMGDIAKAANISRQAVYLHFTSRAELLEATTRHLDRQLNLEHRLEPSRAATTGADRLARYIEFWGNYIPEIYPVAKALLLAQDTDEAAATAWRERMQAMRDGCRAAIEALAADGDLAPQWTAERATDMLWTLLSVRNWEQLTQDCGWPASQYIQWMQTVAHRTFVAN
ncbi:TetR/AcrR family transcriptional regulator [Sulfidibacter corallicola]|uniref:TetR/AcrR family transcriptional regulator n=1 Tax=Sulfidibacter corallicola TaxID=2818388 RepID=A0A8A4TNE0_SULCO|nr:TetR/AcrR family transcriptional regulator [Sulfidibacter corallicola]QTD50622.1 TetR/AcrR family transcriptional regulator [Sulfidibacter corallicola]